MKKELFDLLNLKFKLQRLSDEINFNVVLLLDGLINGIYILTEDGFIEEDRISSLEHFKEGWGFTLCDNDYEILLADYGITWSTNRFELEVQ